MSTLHLGLIGDNITRSKSPLLHKLAGRICGIEITYQALIPADLNLDFDAVFERCSRNGYRGINITYPYKERVVSKLAVDDRAVRLIGACNTVVFDGTPPRGLNTDFTGFSDAFRGTFGAVSPGVVALVGTGGVGRAVAFALAHLDTKGLQLFDVNRASAERLASTIASTGNKMVIEVAASIGDAVTGADGLVNCTPLGMVGLGGTAIPVGLIRGQSWAFDAVYTPVETEFLINARAAGLSIMSGYELFLHQGVNAFRIFTGRDVDPLALRAALLESAPERRMLA